MRRVLQLIFLFSISMVQGQTELPPHPNSYVCYKTYEGIVADGKLDEVSWQQAAWTESFMDIEGPLKSQPTQRTRTKMIWNDSTLFIGIRMEETHVWASLTERESIIYHDNDIEIFIDPTANNHHYAELEFNAFGTVMDLLLARPYRDSVVPSFSWNCAGMEHGISIEGTINDPSDIDTAWTIELAIPLAAISDLVYKYVLPEAGDQWRINFSRVQWITKVENEKYVKLRQPEHNWVWSPQWTINMHQPEYWGYLQFSDNTVGTEAEIFNEDPYWNERMQLMAVYRALKTYRVNNPAYTVNLEDLTLPEYVKKEHISIEANSEQFLVRFDMGESFMKVDHRSLLSQQWKN
jgi:hypothetical protein